MRKYGPTRNSMSMTTSRIGRECCSAVLKTLLLKDDSLVCALLYPVRAPVFPCVPQRVLLYPCVCSSVPLCSPVLPESRSCDLSSTSDRQPSRREEELRQPVHLEPPLRGRRRRGHTSTIPDLLPHLPTFHRWTLRLREVRGQARGEVGHSGGWLVVVAALPRGSARTRACTVSFQHHHSSRPRSNYRLILERHFRVLARSQDVPYFLHPGCSDKTEQAKYGSIRDTLAVPCEASAEATTTTTRTMMQSCHIMQPLSWGSIQHPHRRLPHLLFLLFLYSLTSCSNGITSMTEKEATVPLLGAIPDTPFRCLGHSAGYYADPDTGCQVYHMCDSLERQYSYLCPNYTLFNQKFMVCDHWYMVNCSSSPTFYHLNSHIGEVPGKTEEEEEQNAITVGPEGDASPRRSKGTLPQTPLTGAPFPPSGPSKDASRPRLGFKQSGTLPVKGTLFKTPTKPTEQPHTSITKKPASVARGPGNRFSFTNHREEEIALTPEDLQRIVFQPLLARPRTKTRRVLTSAPSLLPIDPANITDPHLHHFPMRIEFPDPVIPEDSSSRSSLDLKLSNSQGTQAPPHLLISPSVSPAVHPLSTFLSPPTHPFTPIMRMRQEFPTPLAVPQEDHNLRTSPRETFLPGARRLPFPSSTRGNRDFFIPSTEFSELSLLVSELSPNILEEPAQNPSHSTSDHDHHHHHHGDHMTMVFPAPIEPHMMEELKLNPECPRCHPEFLKPGQCNPCVVINILVPASCSSLVWPAYNRNNEK
ncbi:hypothetical protein O3P69_016721 [Scylla paramamosain]|uniref:Chitin-binding type-2 domain-containing protein n=1 Tax=Scylla paramamosain TaxID=85552 RepID=A0AAW0SZV3_SCYPA